MFLYIYSSWWLLLCNLHVISIRQTQGLVPCTGLLLLAWNCGGLVFLAVKLQGLLEDYPATSLDCEAAVKLERRWKESLYSCTTGLG